jgi:hypothetical protein
LINLPRNDRKTSIVVPTVPGGDLHVIAVDDTDVTVPGDPPKSQEYKLAAPVPAKKFLPWNTTEEPPEAAPEIMLRPVT